jgi:hypothetical protein
MRQFHRQGQRDPHREDNAFPVPQNAAVNLRANGEC